MRSHVVISLVMVVVWLGVGIGMMVAYPTLRRPWSDDPRSAPFWIILTVMVAWNLFRAYRAWKSMRARAQAQAHESTRFS